MLYKILIIYLLIINIIGFVLMGIDKQRAIRGAWRISEASLFLTAFLGGALGCTLGMHRFRHKTKHKSFTIGIPALLILHIAVVILLFSQGWLL